MQIAVAQKLIHSGVEFVPFLHTELHNDRVNRKTMKANQIIVLTWGADKRIVQSNTKSYPLAKRATGWTPAAYWND